MNNIHQITSKEDARIEEASAWVSMLDRGLSSEEEQALKRWLQQHPKNQAELFETARFFDKLDELSRLADIFPEANITKTPRSDSSSFWKIAAAIVLAIGLSVLGLSSALLQNDQKHIASNEPKNHYETAIGEQTVFKLSDGTELVLNTNSSVSVEYTAQNRLLILERGEIHVKVAHNPSRPLSVMVGNRIVQAVGTAFNVEIKADQQVELLVTEGVVVVGVRDKTVEDDFINKPPILVQNESGIIAAGQAVMLAQEDESITAKDVKVEEIAVKLSWREGNLIFRGETLEEVVEEVERYTKVEFVFLDEDSKKVRLAGLFRAGDVDGLLYALRENFNIAYERKEDGKVLLNQL